MKISIITPSFNSSLYIRETIEDIQRQTYTDYEHIIVDAVSNDGTLDIFKQYPEIKWISEKDSGQSDAINKGFAMSTGDILAWQNADDLYFPNTFELVTRFFQENPQVDIVYGDYQLIDQYGDWVCDVKPPEWNEWLFAHGRFVPMQPTVFWRKHVYEEIGDLDESLHYCMDVDYFARTAKQNFTFAKIPSMLGKFRVHTDSKTQSGINEQKIHAEHKKVLSRTYNYSKLDELIFNLYYSRAKIGRMFKGKPG